MFILGGGFAGVYCARAIAKALGSKLRFTRIAIISEENYMVSRVTSDSAAVGPRGLEIEEALGLVDEAFAHGGVLFAKGLGKLPQLVLLSAAELGRHLHLHGHV